MQTERAQSSGYDYVYDYEEQSYSYTINGTASIDDGAYQRMMHGDISVIENYHPSTPSHTSSKNKRRRICSESNKQESTNTCGNPRIKMEITLDDIKEQTGGASRTKHAIYGDKHVPYGDKSNPVVPCQEKITEISGTFAECAMDHVFNTVAIVPCEVTRTRREHNSSIKIKNSKQFINQFRMRPIHEEKNCIIPGLYEYEHYQKWKLGEVSIDDDLSTEATFEDISSPLTAGSEPRIVIEFDSEGTSLDEVDGTSDDIMDMAIHTKELVEEIEDESDYSSYTVSSTSLTYSDEIAETKMQSEKEEHAMESMTQVEISKSCKGEGTQEPHHQVHLEEQCQQESQTIKDVDVREAHTAEPSANIIETCNDHQVGQSSVCLMEHKVEATDGKILINRPEVRSVAHISTSELMMTDDKSIQSESNAGKGWAHLHLEDQENYTLKVTRIEHGREFSAEEAREIIAHTLSSTQSIDRSSHSDGHSTKVVQHAMENATGVRDEGLQPTGVWAPPEADMMIITKSYDQSMDVKTSSRPMFEDESQPVLLHKATDSAVIFHKSVDHSIERPLHECYDACPCRDLPEILPDYSPMTPNIEFARVPYYTAPLAPFRITPIATSDYPLVPELVTSDVGSIYERAISLCPPGSPILSRDLNSDTNETATDLKFQTLASAERPASKENRGCCCYIRNSSNDIYTTLSELGSITFIDPNEQSIMMTSSVSGFNPPVVHAAYLNENHSLSDSKSFVVAGRFTPSPLAGDDASVLSKYSRLTMSAQSQQTKSAAALSPKSKPMNCCSINRVSAPYIATNSTSSSYTYYSNVNDQITPYQMIHRDFETVHYVSSQEMHSLKKRIHTNSLN